MSFELIHGDCLVELPKLKTSSIDLVLCDLPYGVTQNKWDSQLPLTFLWEEYRRLCKGPVVLTATQPFTTTLISSNPKEFKYTWVWQRDRPSGHLNAKKMPLRDHEDVVVFRTGVYNPQMTNGKPSHSVGRGGKQIQQTYGEYEHVNTAGNEKYPRTVLFFPRPHPPIHPTQKPVALMEYLIRTYTNPGATVLDHCMGSGTSGIACVNTERNFIGMENDKKHFEIAKKRIEDARNSMGGLA